MNATLANRTLWAAAVGLAVVTGLALLSQVVTDDGVGWVLDLLSHWPKHLALAGLVVGVGAGVRRMRIAAGVAVAVAAVNGALVTGLSGFALPQAAPADVPLLRVASANVHGSMAALERLASAAKAYGADIVSAYEAPEELQLADLARLFPDLTVQSLPSKRLEGWPLRRRSLLVAQRVDEIRLTAFMGSHGVILRTNAEGVQVVTTHPPSPGDSETWRDRNRQLATIGDGLDTEAPFIVMGDFNTTPWGRAYATAPGMRAGDPRFEGTFPVFAGPLGLPIDHIRFGGGLQLTDYRVGGDIGSGHLPLFATFARPAPKP